MIDRALESCSTSYILAMRILFYELCSLIRSLDSHREWGIYTQTVLKEIYD